MGPFLQYIFYVVEGLTSPKCFNRSRACGGEPVCSRVCFPRYPEYILRGTRLPDLVGWSYSDRYPGTTRGDILCGTRVPNPAAWSYSGRCPGTTRGIYSGVPLVPNMAVWSYSQRYSQRYSERYSVGREGAWVQATLGLGCERALLTKVVAT